MLPDPLPEILFYTRMNNAVNLPGMFGATEKVRSKQSFIQYSTGIYLLTQQSDQLAADTIIRHHKLFGFHIGDIDRYPHHFQQSGYNTFTAANTTGYTYPDGHNEGEICSMRKSTCSGLKRT